MLVHWDKWLSVWCSKYCFFFHDFLQNHLKKWFQCNFLKFINLQKIEFWVYKKLWKTNAWNIWHLINDSFIPAKQQTSVLYLPPPRIEQKKMYQNRVLRWTTPRRQLSGPPPASRTQWGRLQRPRTNACAWRPPSSVSHSLFSNSFVNFQANLLAIILVI